jgi:serine/threonine protein kinase
VLLAQLVAKVHHTLSNVYALGVPKLIALYRRGGKLYTVMEGCTGDLCDLIGQKGPLGPEKSLSIMLILARSLCRYLLNANFLHCDLKPQNVLFTTGVNGRMNYKISDFGSSSIGVSYFFMKKQNFGTPTYMPIEAILNCLEVLVSPKMDAWSLGLIFCYLASGCEFIEQERHFDNLGTCSTMMAEALRHSSSKFKRLVELDIFEAVALWLFLVFFPFQATLPTANILVQATTQQDALQTMIKSKDFKIAHERLALFRWGEGVVGWNETSPFYPMMGFDGRDQPFKDKCCQVLSGLMDFDPAKRHSLAKIITLLD